MSLLFNQKQEIKSSTNRLSVARPQQQTLNLNREQQVPLKTKTSQKMKVIIYMNNGKYFVAHATAYALGLINTRAVMLDNPKLVEITQEMHNRLKSNPNITIEYVEKVQKQKLKVFVEENRYYIETSAAYALGLLSLEKFSSVSEKKYYIDGSLLTSLKDIYDIEFHSASITEDNDLKNNL